MRIGTSSNLTIRQLKWRLFGEGRFDPARPTAYCQDQFVTPLPALWLADALHLCPDAQPLHAPPAPPEHGICQPEPWPFDTWLPTCLPSAGKHAGLRAKHIPATIAGIYQQRNGLPAVPLTVGRDEPRSSEPFVRIHKSQTAIADAKGSLLDVWA